MSRRYRLVLMVLSLALMVLLGRVVTGSFNFLVSDFWFVSGILLLVLLSLVDQPHFSKDSGVFVNAVTAIISLYLVVPADRDSVFWSFFAFCVYLILISYFLMWIRHKSPETRNRHLAFLSKLNRQLGRPDVIFSAFFLWGAAKQFAVESGEFNALLLYWIIFRLLNLPYISKLIEQVFDRGVSKNEAALIGRIFGVRSRSTFLVKLDDAKPQVKLFDFVEFVYSADEMVRRGVVLDIYLLNAEQWCKVFANEEINKIFPADNVLESHVPDLIYRIDGAPDNNYATRFVGAIAEESCIGLVKFVYNSKTSVLNGQLLEVEIADCRVLYQIIEGVTKIEQLEDKNQAGMIVGEAIQLGTWDTERLQFEQYGWVPEVNTPVYLSTDIEAPSVEPHEVLVGCIPDTNYPVILNKNLAMSHHMAVIGVTGSGKSVFSRNLIREFIKENDTKVICIDFTGEYVGKFRDLEPVNVVSPEVSDELFRKIDKIEREMAGNYNKDNDASRALKKEVSKSMHDEIQTFLEGGSDLSIFELPHVENTSGVLTYTKVFFRNLFHIAKTKGNYGKRVCLVLEEAHTVVPEWNFSGIGDKISQPLLNSIAQIALQGRKYNVGMLVIAQRSANVSKTILTQCNTIVSFQGFDKTSSEFLSNYFSKEFVDVLPRLKFRQAVAAGKAFRSSVPIIFEVPEIIEED